MVMFNKKDTKEPAALPLPGPTTIFWLLAQLTISWTIKKYEANPVFSITDNSYSRRFLSSSKEAGSWVIFSVSAVKAPVELTLISYLLVKPS